MKDAYENLYMKLGYFGHPRKIQRELNSLGAQEKRPPSIELSWIHVMSRSATKFLSGPSTSTPSELDHLSALALGCLPFLGKKIHDIFI